MTHTKESLRNLQDKYGLGVTEFAKKIGITYPLLNNIYSGRTKKVSHDISEKAKAFELTMSAKEDTLKVTEAEKLFLITLRSLSQSKRKQSWEFVFNSRAQECQI